MSGFLAALVRDIAESGWVGFFRGLALSAGRGCVMFGQAIVRVPSLRHWRNFDKVIRQTFICGVASIPVVTITAAFSGMVISGQTGWELRRIGLEGTIGMIVGAAMVREMGPVFSAVVVAGFVGGGMASVLGTMRVSEEIDALEVMSINPIRYLVTPRLVAMMFALPVLTIYADIIGILGGMVVARYQLDVTYRQFWDMCTWALAVKDVGFGLIKAFIFGIIITMVACEEGFAAEGGAEGVGRATMRSVVYSFLMILVANYLVFSLIYIPIWGAK